jgi:hypothetical protein
MDAHELVTRYETGERDFSWANLYQADLSGAVLPRAVLYHVNLIGANLREAKPARGQPGQGRLDWGQPVRGQGDQRTARQGRVSERRSHARRHGARVSSGGRLVGESQWRWPLTCQSRSGWFYTMMGGNKNPSAYPENRKGATCFCDSGLLARITTGRSGTALSTRPRPSLRRRRLPRTPGCL